MERIAIIGWGSLLWDLDDLAAHVSGDWQVAAGPTLPIEFALVSRKRNGALAAVIDHALGAHSPCSVIDSAKNTLAEAIHDLARRERCAPQHIGALHRHNGFSQAKQTQTSTLVEIWLHTTHYDGAVWTDIETNFHTTIGQPFTISTAVAYLQSLSGDSLREAKRYIENAPAEVATPLRRELAAHDWWAALDYE